MPELWQNALAITLCLAAAGYVSFRAWKVFTKRAKPGCGSGCGTCSSGENHGGAKIKPLIAIELPRSRHEKTR